MAALHMIRIVRCRNRDQWYLLSNEKAVLPVAGSLTADSVIGECAVGGLTTVSAKAAITGSKAITLFVNRKNVARRVI